MRTISLIATLAVSLTMNLTFAAEERSRLPADMPELTVARLLGSPSLDGPSLSGVKVSPDGSRVTYLKGKETDFRQQDLWEYHIADRQQRLLVDSDELLGGATEVLSEEEKARRERQRIGSTGIVEYYWNEAGTALIFPINGDIYELTLGQGPRQVTASEAFETDVRFSPKGNYLSFIRDRDLYIVHLESGKETRLTEGANEVIAHGVAEFVAQEELDRDTGYWWSPDESRIAFTRIDESPVAVLDRYELNPDGTVTSRKQRYPAAGTANAIVSLGVVRLADQEISWVDLGEEADIYLARVNWFADSSGLTFQRLPRDQESLDVIAVDADGSGGRRIIHETSNVWINLHHDFKSLKQSADLLWTSERSGFRHIYRVSRDGASVAALTRGDWVVSEIVGVDESAGVVYFTGFKDSTIEQHLYRASLDPAATRIERVTQAAGWHRIAMGQQGEVFLDSFSSPDTPPKLAIRSSADGSLIDFVIANALDESHPYWPYWPGHAPSEFGQITAADGTTQLDYRLILPPDLDPDRKYPAILAPYGGPHGHSVARVWDVDDNQLLARRGFVVMVVDNRGSYNRGVAFEAPIKDAMGGMEVEDQIAAARYLQSLDYIDPDRIGFHGWSYGGYMTLMMMAKAPDLIKVGVAGAPVTDWRLYDTAYTERYLGLPDAPGDVYEKSSVFHHLDGLAGKLLVIHGMADDNVFFDNTVKLLSVLQESGFQFDLMTYPGQKHAFRGEKILIHRSELRLRYFEEHL